MCGTMWNMLLLRRSLNYNKPAVVVLLFGVLYMWL